MKINSLTEENIKELKEGTYVIFNEEGILKDITHFHHDVCGRPFDDFYNEYGGDSLKDFKRRNENDEMFPIELVKKPGENNNEN